MPTELITVFSSEQFEYNSGWPPSDALGFIQWLQDKINQIPPEYRDSAQIELNAFVSHDQPGIDLEIYYYCIARTCK